MRVSRKVTTALVALAVVALGVPSAALAESWTNVPLVDVKCSLKVKDNPDVHTRDCALMCAKSGYGIWTADGKYLKFDAAGSQRALELLKASDRKDHLRVDVTGELVGDTMTVTTLAFAAAN